MAAGGEARTAYAGGTERALLIVILAALTSLAPFSTDMYLPALPALARDFHVPASAAEHTIAAFFVGFTFGQMFAGTLADRLGRKLPVYLGVGLYVAASLGCALAPSIDALIALRVFQALGACAGMVVARAVVRDLFAERDAAHVMSHMVLAMGLAPLIAPLMGGYILLYFGWRADFLTMTVIALAILTAAALGLPETHPPEKRRRLRLGAMLHEYRYLARQRNFVGYALGGSISHSCLFVYITASPHVFIDYFHVAPQHYGWLFGANATALITASQVNAAFLKRLPARLVLRGAHLVQLAGATVLLFNAWTGFGGLTAIVVSLFLCAPMNGAVVPTATALALSPHGERAGAASALFGTLQFGLAAVFSYVVAAIAVPGPLPMASVIFGCAVLAITFNLSTRPANPPSPT